MTTATRHMTADDLFLMPDDGFRYELVRGELRKMSPAGHAHGSYAAEIDYSISHHVRRHALGKTYSSDTGFLLAPDLVRAPDASFVRRARAEAAKDVPGFFPGPPDLAVEVISPTDLMADVQEKIKDYLDAGTLAVVVANPRNPTVSVHRSSMDAVEFTESDTLEVPDVLPGWSMPVADIFSLD